MEARIKTRIWVQALLRRIESEGSAAAVVTVGDEDAGAVLLKVNRFDAGCLVYTQVRDDKGRPAWLRGTGDSPVPEIEADSYINRQLEYDADLWVVEVEDQKGTFRVNGVTLDV